MGGSSCKHSQSIKAKSKPLLWEHGQSPSETIGFIIGNIVSFVNVLFVVLEHPFYIYGMVSLRTIFTLIPFYLVFSYMVLIDNILIGYGKTQYCFMISVIVNLIYYPIVYGLMLKGVFVPNITFICMMFGFGMVAHLICSILCFILYKRSDTE